MLIDWFTVAAQALNFAILIGLMKRFLYKPILEAIDAREHRIATQLATADRQMAQAQQERQAFQDKNEHFDQEREKLLAKAHDDAAAERQQLLAAARQAADALATQRQTSLANEATALVQTLRQRAQSEVFAIARHTLVDLADRSLEASACGHFITRLQALDGPDKTALVEALGGGAPSGLVRSAFELPPAQRTAIQKAIAQSLGLQPQLRFETEPELVAGIELVAQGQKFSWTISGHLSSLERGVAELLKAQEAAA